MSKAKHTQGEWKVGKTALNEFTSIWVGSIRIALVDEVPYEGSEANARLIAEAPTLKDYLSSARVVLARMRRSMMAHPDNEAGSEFEDRISDLDELIRAQEDADAALMDDFAKAAMQGMISNPAYDPCTADKISELAYGVATSMMQERERRMK